MPYYRTEIQKKLLALAAAGTFYAISYDAGQPVVDEANSVTPTALANETSSAFEPDPNYRRGDRDERADWQFELHLRFAREVLLESFEESLMLTPPQFTVTGLSRPIRLRLVSAAITHPRQQGGETTAIYTIRAELAPR